jgi:hypothetical protein
MVLTPDPKLEAALSEHARRRGVPVEVLALDALRERFLAPTAIQPQDEWEQRLLAVAKDCGVSLSDATLGREAIYE